MNTDLTAAFEDLFSPWVMRSAWNKVQAWYATGELYDPAEYLAWQADPVMHLAKLADDLVNDRYSPDPFPLIPYPKKNDRTRHFVVPSVRDQVAFTSYMVLLGPFLEARMPNVSFGHRMYRPRVQHDGKWHNAPFSLSHTQIYDPFSSGYGLFRRLLQWLTNGAILDEKELETIKDELQLEDPDRLPYWKRGVKGDLAWARLDLSAAYPSVDRERLAKRLVSLMEFAPTERESPAERWGRPIFPTLEVPAQENGRLFARTFEATRSLPEGEVIPGQPWQMLADDTPLRCEVAARLGRLTQAIEYTPWWEPPGWDGADLGNPRQYHPQGPARLTAYKPEKDEPYDSGGIWPVDCHLEASHFEGNKFGLPTGLAISGMLLNVALTSVDSLMCQQFDAADSEESRRRVIYLRFVDDIVLLSADASALEEAIIALRTELAKASPAFYLSPHKAEPKAVERFLGELDDPHLSKPARLQFPSSQYLSRANVETFTTTVVREMSGLAQEALEESFGATGIQRLNQLIELAARNEEDSEVGTDARVSFSVNKLARAAWPRTAVRENGRLISPASFRTRIMNTAERALRQHPWRFKLWKSLLIIAIRANIPYGNDFEERTEGDIEESGEEWLRKKILPLIRWDGGRGPTPISQTWEQDLDDGPATSASPRRTQHRRLRTSFHRAWFWRQWAACVRELERLAAGEMSPDPEYWGSHLNQEQALQALGWFGSVATWAKVLYPRQHHPYWPGGRPFLWWWEAESLRGAILARLDPSVEMLAALHNPRPGTLRANSLHLPGVDDFLRDPELDQLRDALHRVGSWRQLEPPTTFAPPKIAFAWLLHCRQDFLKEFLNSTAPGTDSLSPRPGADADGWAALARLDLWPDWAALRDQTFGDRPPLVPGSTLWQAWGLLDSYSNLRRVLLAHGATVTWARFASWFELFRPRRGGRRPKGSNSLLQAMYRLNGDSAPADAEVPAIELDAHVAFAITRAALRKGVQASRAVVTPDTVYLSDAAFESLVDARRMLLLAGAAPLPESAQRANAGAETLLRDRAADELIRFLRGFGDGHIYSVQPLTYASRAPHPLFLLPELLLNGAWSKRAAEGWRSALLLLWMAAGGERILDQLWRTAPWHPPLSERDDYRSTLVLPEAIWGFIERHLGSHNALSLYRQSQPSVVGPSLDATEELVKVRDITFHGDDWQVAPPGSLKILNTSDRKELHVRLIQAVSTPGKKADMSDWAKAMTDVVPAFDRAMYESVAGELADRLREARGQAHVYQLARQPDDILLLPEWFTPEPYVRKLKQFVRETSVAILSGVLIRELPRVVPVVPEVKRRGWRVLVNEAVLIMPNRPVDRPEADKMFKPSRVFEFRIRKPYPAAVELGFIRYLSTATGPSNRWAFLSGLSWYRWNYWDWGNFSVAICSDILDTYIWDWLRGRIQHLFLPAWNNDIELFDQFAWTRGYELFANVACTNHGSKGGSVAWTPKHEHSKELFRVHGHNKGLAVSVDLPVKAMIEAQDTALEEAVRTHHTDWSHGAKPEKRKVFKAPAPGYRRKP